MKKIRNNLEYNWKSEKGEGIFSPSQTVPDEGTSIREILMRYSQGYEYARKPSEYENPENFDEVDPTRVPGFDLSDAHQELVELNEKLAAAKTKGRKKEPEKTTNGESSEPGEV